MNRSHDAMWTRMNFYREICRKNCSFNKVRFIVIFPVSSLIHFEYFDLKHLVFHLVLGLSTLANLNLELIRNYVMEYYECLLQERMEHTLVVGVVEQCQNYLKGGLQPSHRFGSARTQSPEHLKSVISNFNFSPFRLMDWLTKLTFWYIYLSWCVQFLC